MNGYRPYLLDLARELGCNMYLGPDTAGMMYVEFGYVEGPNPDNSPSYTPQQCLAVGLHELGHYYHGHTQGRPPMGHLTEYFDRGVLRSEAEAWEYALTHFEKREEIIEEETRRFMWHHCLNSYYMGALASAGRSDCQLWNGDRHHVKFTYDEADEFFFSIRDALVGEVLVSQI